MKKLAIRYLGSSPNLGKCSMKKLAIRYLGWGLLGLSKPFTKVGNFIWKLHRTVLDWNK